LEHGSYESKDWRKEILYFIAREEKDSFVERGETKTNGSQTNDVRSKKKGKSPLFFCKKKGLPALQAVREKRSGFYGRRGEMKGRRDLL